MPKDTCSSTHIHWPFLRVVAMLLSAASLAGPGTALTLRGQVLTPEGNPVEAAEVWAYQDWRVQREETGADGRFVFEGLDVAETGLLALKAGHAAAGALDLLYGGAEIELKLGKPEPLHLHVVGSQGLDLPGARAVWVAVPGAFGVSVEALAKHGFPDLRSDDQGNITIPWLPEKATIELRVAHYQYADSTLLLAPGEDRAREIVMLKGVSVRGRVKGPQGPVPDARIGAFRIVEDQLTPFTQTQSDPEGLYHLRLGKGTYLLRARQREYASPEPHPLVIESARGAAQTVDLELARPRLLEGSVVFPDKTPCPGVGVTYRAGVAMLDDAFTGADGRFSLKVAGPDGLLHVNAPPGYMTEALADIPVRMFDVWHVRIPAIRLEELPAVKGQILNPGGEPAARVLVSSLIPRAPAWMLTDEDGRFSMRLTEAPEKGKGAFRAEHAEEFWRAEFNVNLKRLKPAKERLKPFEPKTEHMPASVTGNDLSELLDKGAPGLDCQEWFNTDSFEPESFRGKVIVLTFWAGFDESPLGISRIEHLRALYDLLTDAEDIAFLGIHDGLSEPYEVEDYIAARGIPFPVGLDNEEAPTFRNYGVTAIPQTVLIDQRGVLRHHQVEGRLLELIKALQQHRK